MIVQYPNSDQMFLVIDNIILAQGDRLGLTYTRLHKLDKPDLFEFTSNLLMLVRTGEEKELTNDSIQFLVDSLDFVKEVEGVEKFIFKGLVRSHGNGMFRENTCTDPKHEPWGLVAQRIEQGDTEVRGSWFITDGVNVICVQVDVMHLGYRVAADNRIASPDEKTAVIQAFADGFMAVIRGEKNEL